jgi:hypothetical protein
MSEFKKVPIFFDENEMNSWLRVPESRLEYFQELVNMYNGLMIDEPLQYDDLKALIVNPKDFISKRLIKDEKLTIGGLQLNFEKVYEIIEKPNGTDALINKIINDRQDWELQKTHRNVGGFGIEDFTTVVIHSKHLADATESSTVYIKSENEQKAFDILNILVENMNLLNNLTAHGSLKQLLWESYFKTDNYTGSVVLNPYFGRYIR